MEHDPGQNVQKTRPLASPCVEQEMTAISQVATQKNTNMCLHLSVASNHSHKRTYVSQIASTEKRIWCPKKTFLAQEGDIRRSGGAQNHYFPQVGNP